MGKASIHPTAIIHPAAELGDEVSVGPYAVIEDGVKIGAKSEIQSHAVVTGKTELGEEVKVFPFAVIGASPQHLNYRGEPTRVKIGNRVILRECVTVHRGTSFGRTQTEIGDDSFVMAYCHVAHDCVVGKRVIMANGVNLAGHVEIEDNATVGGMTAVIQHCRVGRYAYIGGASVVRKDVLPFVAGKGNEFAVQGINTVGLTRNGFSETTVKRLRKMYRILFLQRLTVPSALEKILLEMGESDELRILQDFIERSSAGIYH